MGKLFGYPVFDKTGEMILTAYDNEYKEMMMDIRVYRMKGQESRKFYREGEEMAILLLSGEVIYEWEGKSGAASRKDVFTEGPWCLHVAGCKEVTVTAKKETEILVQCTRNEGVFESRLHGPGDAPWGYSCVGKFGNVAKRTKWRMPFLC